MIPLKHVRVTVMTAALIGAVATGIAEAKELRLAFGASERTPWGKAVTAFQEKMAETLDGTLTIKPYFSGALDEEQEAVRPWTFAPHQASTCSPTGLSSTAPTTC